MSDPTFSEYADGFADNMRKLGVWDWLAADGFAEVMGVPGGRMWRSPSHTFDLVLPGDEAVWLLVPHHIKMMSSRQMSAEYDAKRRAIFNVLLLGGGAVVPRAFPSMTDLERLIQFDARDAEIARLRGVIERNKAKFIELQSVCKRHREAIANLGAEVADIREVMEKLNKNMAMPIESHIIDAGEA